LRAIKAVELKKKEVEKRCLRSSTSRKEEVKGTVIFDEGEKYTWETIRQEVNVKPVLVMVDSHIRLRKSVHESLR